MTQKLWSVQAVDKHSFHNRPAHRFQQPARLRIPERFQATVMHTTKAAAQQQADELALVNKDHVFLVMEAVHASYSTSLTSIAL